MPILKHSRVPADFVLENHLSGESIQDTAENFGLDPKDIREVLAYAAAHIQPLIQEIVTAVDRATLHSFQAISRR